jgi:RNA polymerase sigma-70 factor (ECF subfamily)
MTMTDADVVRRVLDGDADAFKILVDRYYDRCLRLATHLSSGSADAEDVVQDAFLRAYRHLASYQERDRFAPWLFRIVVNQCRTLGARRRGLAALHERAAAERDSDDAAVDHPAERSAQRDELQRAMATLDPEQREAIVLRFTEDLSYDEMSALTGVGVSALKMRVQRACRRLRTFLTETSHVRV